MLFTRRNAAPYKTWNVPSLFAHHCRRHRSLEFWYVINMLRAKNAVPRKHHENEREQRTARVCKERQVYRKKTRDDECWVKVLFYEWAILCLCMTRQNDVVVHERNERKWRGYVNISWAIVYICEQKKRHIWRVLKATRQERIMNAPVDESRDEIYETGKCHERMRWEKTMKWNRWKTLKMRKQCSIKSIIYIYFVKHELLWVLRQRKRKRMRNAHVQTFTQKQNMMKQKWKQWKRKIKYQYSYRKVIYRGVKMPEYTQTKRTHENR